MISFETGKISLQTRFGQVYKIGKTDILSKNIRLKELLEKKATEQNVAITMIDNEKEPILTLYTGREHSLIAKQPQIVQVELTEFNKKSRKFDQELSKKEDALLDKARERILQKFLLPCFQSPINRCEVNHVFKTSVNKYVKKGKTLEEIANDISVALKDYKKADISFKVFENKVQKAVLEFLKSGCNIKAQITDALIRFNNQNAPFNKIVFKNICDKLPGQPSLKYFWVNLWLKTNLFDIETGKPKPGWIKQLLLLKFRQQQSP